MTELQKLFEQLKTSTAKSVTPTEDLASLTMWSDQTNAMLEGNIETLARKKSISSPEEMPNLQLAQMLHTKLPDTIEASPIPVKKEAASQLLSPSPSPPSTSSAPLDEDIVMVEKPTEDGDNSSDTTLIGDEQQPERSRVLESPEMDSFNSTAPIGDEEQPAWSRTLDSPDMGPAESDSAPNTDDVEMIDDDGGTHHVPMPASAPPPPPRPKPDLSIQTKHESTSTVKMEDKFRFGAQQDVTEAIGNVIERLRCAIEGSSVQEGGEQGDIIYDTLYFEVTQFTLKPTGMVKKSEIYANLKLYPPTKTGVADFYDALDVDFDVQMVESDGSSIPQYRSIVKLPSIIQLLIQRTAFEKNRGAWKNENEVKFPETIYMDRYMDTNDAALTKRRRDAWQWKAQLRKLEARQAVLLSTNSPEAEKLGITVHEGLTAAHAVVRSLQESEIDGVNVSPDLVAELERRAAQIEKEIRDITAKISDLKMKLQNQFTDLRKYEYKLQTVFIHRGQDAAGHYFIYLYDFENSVWRKYNDDTVTQVTDRNKIFTPNADGTPYFLAYVRSSDTTLVNAVVRDVNKEAMEFGKPLSL